MKHWLKRIGAVLWRALLGLDEVRRGARQAHSVQCGGDQVTGQGLRNLRTSKPKHARRDVCGRRAPLGFADLLIGRS